MRSYSNIRSNVTDEVAARVASDEIAAFRRSAETAVNRVNVDASGGEVFLAGARRSWAQRRSPD
jgi:hypothetical protein